MPSSARIRSSWSRALRAAALAALLGASATLFAAQTVRLTNGEWPPFTSESLPHGGLLTRIVTQSFALEGISVRYGYFPWKRAYAYAKNGEWDGSLGWELTDEHLANFYLSEPVIYVDRALFHLKRVPFDWTTIDDLRRWRLGAAAGYSYGEQWDRAVRSGRIVVEEAATDATNLRKLLLGRVDAVAMETDVAEYLMRQLLTPQEAAQITHHPRRLPSMPICLALSRQLADAPELLARFNRGLQRLKESGVYAAYHEDARQANPIDTAPEGPPRPRAPGKALPGPAKH